MNQRWILLSLLSGLALSQVPSSTPRLTPGQLYRLHVEDWSPEGRLVEIRVDGRVIGAKRLGPMDPDWTLHWRASGDKVPVANVALQVEAVKDPLAIESSGDAERPIDVELDREYHALADERPYFTGRPEQGVDWYRVKNRKRRAVMAYLGVAVGDRELPSDVETFRVKAEGGLEVYREGSYAYTPEATQTMPGLGSFRVRRLEAGAEVLVRVAANHPAYTLRLKSYEVERGAAEAVRMGMDFLVSLGASWHANVPRRGAVATRETLPHGEIQGCVACHPTVFTLRAYDAARKRGWADVNPAARAMLVEQLRNHPRPLPGHEGVSWTRTIFSARAISARTAGWTRELLPYLKLTGTEHWAEEADGAAPNVSPFEIAVERYAALGEPEVGSKIANEPARNVVDLNWKLIGMARMGKPVDALVKQLFAAQRADGLFPYQFAGDEEGAEFITWHALYALAEAGLGLEDARVKRLFELCLSRQRASGEWQGETSHKAFDTPFRDTQFAVMALSRLVKAEGVDEVESKWDEMQGKAGAVMRARKLRAAGDVGRVRELLTGSSPMQRYEGLRVFAAQFREWTSNAELLDRVIRLAKDEQPLVRFAAANALARWYAWRADDATMARAILGEVVSGVVTEKNETVRGALQQALYTMIDENEGYLATWNAQIADEAARLKTQEGLEARRKRVQGAVARGLSVGDVAGKVALLEALWDHPQRHAGLPEDLERRSEVVLPKFFSEYSRGVDGLHRGGYEPHARNTGFRYGAANPFYKTRVGNDSELPDLGVAGEGLERELLACLNSGQQEVTRAAIRALSVFPTGLSGKLTVAVVKLAVGEYAGDVRYVFANDARGKLVLEQPFAFEKELSEALIAALEPGNRDALETLLPALAAVTPGEGPTRNAFLQGRVERLLLKPEGVPLDLALAAAAVFPHIADGPLMRTTMLEAFASGDRMRETAAVEIFVKSYIAEPTNPVLGKQFAGKSSGAMRRRMLDSLDPARFSLRLSALNRYNPGRDVVLPENANLFSSDVAQFLIGLGVKDEDRQVRRAAAELVWNYEELGGFRAQVARPEELQPDYEYFKQRVQPVLAKVGEDGRACVVCHATQGQFALRMPGKTGFSEAQTRANYEAALRKVNLKEPKRSLLLMKPTRPNDNAGDPALHTSTHGGGTRWGRDGREASSSAEYETILEWIRGGKL